MQLVIFAPPPIPQLDILTILSYLPLVWAALYALALIVRALTDQSTKRNDGTTTEAQDSSWTSYFQVWIEEKHILEAQSDGSIQREAAADVKIETLLPRAPRSLLVMPVLEMIGHAGVLLLSVREEWGQGSRVVATSFRSSHGALLCAWTFAFFRELSHRSQLPPMGLLLLFTFLFAHAFASTLQSFHTAIKLSLLPSIDLLLTLPNLFACATLVTTILRMPLRPPLAAFLHADEMAGGRPISPEDTVHCSLLSSLSYAWMDPLMTLARSRPLRVADVWMLSLNNRAEVLARRFGALREPTLVRRILRASARDILIDVVLKLVAVTLNYLRPYFIQRLLECLSTPSTTSTPSDNPPPWSPRDQAYIFALLAFLSMAGRSLAELQHFHHARRIGMRLRSELTTTVYEKALRRKDVAGWVGKEKDDGREEGEEASASVGKVVSLISDDTNRVLRMGCDAHLIYGSPLEIVLALVFLYNLLGWSSLVGFVILVAAVPLNYDLGKRAMVISRGRSTARDKRQASLQELIAAVRTIKFFGWTEAWTGRVEETRAEEIRWIIKEWVNGLLMFIVWGLVCVSVPLLSFFSYVYWQKEDLTVAIGFTALSLFGMVRDPLNQIPDFGIRLLQTSVSISRIEAFLGEADVAPHATPAARRQVDPARLAFNNASLRHSSGSFEMEDLNIIFPPGELTLISGPVGSGKTSLLLALLGELDVLSGSVDLPSRVSYASQHPWLENGSIRSAIVFGSPYLSSRYAAVLSACALLPDLALLPSGDSTPIGERGVSLSGGQKARIALARALYAPTSVLLLDDPLSAVDAGTAKHLFENVLKGKLMRGRTCVLVTHHAELVMGGVGYRVEMEGGRIARQGRVEREEREAAKQVDDDDDGYAEEGRLGGGEEVAQEGAKAGVEAETWTTGAVQRSIYHTYLTASSYFLWAVLVLFALARPLLILAEQFWLRKWGEAGAHGHQALMYLAGYAALSVGSVVILLLCNILKWTASLRASRTIFHSLLTRVVAAPPRWFDVTPVGRIVNRFTNDMGILDNELANSFSGFLLNIFGLLATLSATSGILPSAIPPVIFVSVVYSYTFVRFLGVSRDLNRIASTTASPLFSGFQQVLLGITTLRSFSVEPLYLKRVYTVLDETLSLWYASCTLDVWLSIRTQLLSALTLLFTSVLAVHSGVSAGLAGIAITGSMAVVRYLDALCGSYGRLVNSLNSLERITEYLELPQEPSDGVVPPASWPSSSGDGPMLSVQDLVVHYSPELPPALKGVSFEVKKGERVAIAGRTGSGKSTLAVSLLRFKDVDGGRISIDGLDISTLNLTSLRQRITLLPQEAVLFSGTIRSNLDPFDDHSDEACLDALRRVHLFEEGKAPIGLDSAVAAGGHNFSSGTRQLLSLARALLRDSRLIIFDESTAALDLDLDAKIQQTLREEFAERGVTVITIAHRLRTIIDYDRVLVLSEGQVVEFASPLELLEKDVGEGEGGGGGGVFRRTCEDSGEWEALLEIAKVTGTGK